MLPFDLNSCPAVAVLVLYYGAIVVQKEGTRVRNFHVGYLIFSRLVMKLYEMALISRLIIFRHIKFPFEIKFSLENGNASARDEKTLNSL